MNTSSKRQMTRQHLLGDALALILKTMGILILSVMALFVIASIMVLHMSFHFSCLELSQVSHTQQNYLLSVQSWSWQLSQAWHQWIGQFELANNTPLWLKHAFLLFKSSVNLIGIKCLVVIAFLPLLLLLSGVGFIDGLVQRHLRRLGGARESALKYHQFKYWYARCFFVGLFFYLTLPIDIAPVWLLLPMAIGMGLTLRQTLTYFKKYA